jgi:hypothetical protein
MTSETLSKLNKKHPDKASRNEGKLSLGAGICGHLTVR